MNDVAAHLAVIRREIESACRKAGRDPGEVRLVAVSKKKPVPLLEQAYAAGQTLFGESYVQEFVDKADAVQLPFEWHFIGALQSNKVKYLRGRVAMIHSVDRLALGEEIDRQWGKLDARIPVLVQVKLGGEETKSGVDEQELETLVRQLALLPHLAVSGLMTLPPWCEDPEAVRPYFRRLRELARRLETLQVPGVTMRELSMGMSHDFAVAVEEGATLVRVGSAIFGARD